MIRRVGPSRCPVLLTGERGTGRAMAARLIHAQGPNRDAPFVKIVCGGASDTGMSRVSGGDVEPGATVYLENVQELSSDEQRHLAVQVGLERAGSLEAAQADKGPRNIRFIGAAPPNVQDLAERGQIRSDLVDALGVVRIDLPPLRQRVEDVPLLAMHFLKAACRMNDIPSKSFSPSALMMLGAMPWPGNAAELRSLMERLAVLVPRGTVLLEDVLAHVRFDGARALGGSRSTLREAREGFERDYIVAVLQQHHGRMGAAATELGIERTNLYRKIKQLNITWAAGAD
jgi:two-component system nitrogen regulation response regulator NtrX